MCKKVAYKGFHFQTKTIHFRTRGRACLAMHDLHNITFKK